METGETKHDVRLLGADLAVDEQSEQMTCPSCRASHERSFGVKRVADGLVFSCFRAKCGLQGFLPDRGTIFDATRAKVQAKEPTPYSAVQELTKPTDRDETFFAGWGVDLMQTDIVWVTHDDAYAFEIQGPRGLRKGWHIRQPRWKSKKSHRYGAPGPKGMTYLDKRSHSKLAWTPSEGKTVVLVEDVISALKISQHAGSSYRGVALLGTDLTQVAIDELNRAGAKRVIIWLDADATNQAYSLLNRWGLCFDHCTVRTSEHDPKDTDRREIRRILDA